MPENGNLKTGNIKVPGADSTANSNIVDVIGNKSDAANETASQASLIGLLRQLLADVDNLERKATKELTFSNTTGPVSLFTVNGDVAIKIIAVCKTGLASAGGCNGELGISGDTDAFVVSTDMTALAANEVWIDASPDRNIEAMPAQQVISNGDDVILTLSAQVDSGAVTFYALWLPLSDDGNVVAA